MNSATGLRFRGAREASSANDESDSERVEPGGAWWLILVGLTTSVLCLPFFRTIIWMPDEGVLLHAADRLLKGEKLYLDFFQFLPPGGFLITALWFLLTGVSFESARCLAILTTVGTACFTYLACRQVTRHSPSSALVAIAWVIMSQGIWTQINHHWFTTLFSTMALWATLASVARPQPWLRGPMLAGLAAGAAAMVTPTRGALVMLAATTVFLRRRPLGATIAYLGASLLVPVALALYVLHQGAFATAFYDVILFPAQRYVTYQGVSYGAFADVRNEPVVILFPITAVLTAGALVLNKRSGTIDRVVLPCIAFGVAGLIGFLPRMDAMHVVFAAPLICPLFVYSIKRLTAGWPQRYRFTLAAAVTILCVPAVIGFLSLAAAVRSFESVETPRGRVLVSAELYGVKPVVERIMQLPPGDGFFFYPFSPTLPFLTSRPHVAKLDVFVPPSYTLPEQYREVCVSILRHARWVVIDLRFIDPDYLLSVFPALRGTQHPGTTKFEQILKNSFAFVARDGVFELRRRTGAVDESACADIPQAMNR